MGRSRVAPLVAVLLAVGTTLGIAALVIVALVPTWRLHLRFRPVLRFPPGVAGRAGGLALVGVVELIAVDIASVVAIARTSFGARVRSVETLSPTPTRIR